MRNARLYRAVQPYLSAVAVIATSAALVFAIYYTEIGPQWTTFLAGLLVASILAEASRVSRSEWLLMRRTAQLAATKDKLEHLVHLHRQDEKNIAAASSRLHLMDEALPTMIALIDGDGRCRYHNQAFRNWLRLRPEQINDRPLREILGSKVYAELATVIRQSLDGQAARYERTHTMPNGAVYHLSLEHVPQLDEKGKVAGFYWLANDLTGRSDVAAPDSGSDAAAQGGQAEQDLFIDSLSEQVTGREGAGKRIFSAIENGEFSLFCQLIAPLESGSGEPDHYESGVFT
ncbi:MAG: PAS domain-containing protein [Nitrosomonadales bacterium]|nr:PAS domain-containing protein [Nitrosomonadales bacterium]